MNINYKLLAETLFLENVRFVGEFWVLKDGNAHSADTDAGDRGHEAVAVQEATYQVFAKLNMNSDSPDSIESDDIEGVYHHHNSITFITLYKNKIFDLIKDKLTEDQKQRYQAGKQMEVMIEYGNTVLKDPKFENLVRAAFDEIDVRRYAMQEWGWKAIRGIVVDTWNITSADLKIISDGLISAYESELDAYNDPKTDSHGYTGPYFDIEVYSRGDYYSRVPFDIIERRNISEIMQYRTITRGERISESGELVGRIKLTPKIESIPDPNLQQKLNDLSKKYEKYLDASAYEYKQYIKLESLLAKKNAPVGTGSAYMKELCDIADQNNLLIVLTTALKGYGGFDGFKKTSSIARLKNFYARFGFVSNYSKRNYRPDLPGDMHRIPAK